MGPKGGGKTVASGQECKFRSVMQNPSPVDQIRRARGAVFRGTYRQIEKNLLPSWFDAVMPKDAPGASFKGGSGGEPAQHEFVLLGNDGIYTEVTVHFLAVDDSNAEEMLQGMELTWAWGNEGTQLPADWFYNIIGRVGRFPKGQHGKPAWYGYWVDYNAPDEDNILYEWEMNPIKTIERVKEVYGDMDDDRAMEILKGTMEFHKQPGGLEPGAENLDNLPNGRGYYFAQIANKPEWWVRRMIHNKYGFSRDGEPVFTDYNDLKHVDRFVRYDENEQLYCGLDAGRTPAAVFVQHTPGRRFKVIREFCFTGSVRPFARALRAFMMEEFGTIECEFVGDPTAADSRSDTDDSNWFEIFADEFGCDEPEPAETNQLTDRLEAVNDLLLAPDIDGAAYFALSPECIMTRRGFNSNYRWKKQPSTNYIDRSAPDKRQPSSHPHDALQYVAMKVTGHNQVLRRREREAEQRQARRRPQPYSVPQGSHDPTGL